MWGVVMNFIEEIYVGENVGDIHTVIYALNRKIPILNVYCICIELYSKFLIEIISSYEISKHHNRFENHTIIGIAEGKKEANDLVRFIIQDAVNGVWDFSNLKQSILKQKVYKKEIL